MLLNSANAPMAVLVLPMVLFKRAPAPIAVFWSTVLKRSEPAPTAVCHVIFTVCHAVKPNLERMEVPFFRRRDEHFFALQTTFGVLHVRCSNVCLKTRPIPPFHVQ
jgi:hypothetical protein